MARAALCRVCASADVVPWLTKRGFPVDRCGACGNAFVPEAAVPADLEALYAPAYFAGGEASGYPTYLRDAALIERNVAQRLAWLERLRPPGRLLDVGSAYGFALKVARARGWTAAGVEIAAECAAAAERLAGVPVVVGDFLRVDVAGPFDAITMFDVLEHFREPRAAVARAWELLVPGGLLVVETGDLASPWARLLGRGWYFLDPPQHLTYFTAAGFAHLLADCGFASPPVLARLGRRVSLANVAFKLAQLAAPVRALARRVADGAPPAGRAPASFYVNFGDAMLVAARRPGPSP